MILTAAHVMTELRRAGRFGVIQHRRMRMEALLPCEDYHFLPLADEPYSYDGPDLGLIVIPPALGHLYEAGIVAVNMDEQLARFQSLDDFASDEGLSAFAGFLDEYTRITPEPDGLGDMAGFSLFAAIGVARSKQRIERHEYFEIEAYRHEVYGPNTWGGMSGSGVWNFPLTTAPDGSLTHKPPLLCGVVFQEGPRQEDHRVVKCHGPSSIYQEALQRT